MDTHFLRLWCFTIVGLLCEMLVPFHEMLVPFHVMLVLFHDMLVLFHPIPCTALPLVIKCEECMFAPATVRCTQCAVDYCTPCDQQIHAAGLSLRRHTSIPITRANSTPYACIAHPEQTKHYYCRQASAHSVLTFRLTLLSLLFNRIMCWCAQNVL